MAKNTIDTRCQVCCHVLSDEEIEKKECLNCIEIKAQSDAHCEWNEDDEYPIPNLIQR